MLDEDPQKQLDAAIEEILASTSRKKLIVAGPGAGKTTLFKMLLERSPGNQTNRLVLTFINNLRDDLEKDLGELAKVFTLHGYCQSLLHKPVNSKIRDGLTSSFRCLPGLASLVKKDWEYLHGEPVPHFVELMRQLAEGAELDFYKDRANYYDAVDFDDSVYRTYQGLKAHPDRTESYELVLIDEYQDFNRLEAGLIELLAERNSIVIAGDDDQALYSQLKGASWEFIRSLHGGGEYQVFKLPFCMRCPEVIVGAVNDIIDTARHSKKLEGRIDKPYLPFAPVKGADSIKYPNIDLIRTTVQRGNANYFGRYIAQEIRKIPQEEIEQSVKKGEPAALIIGSKPYLPQVGEYLVADGFEIEIKKADKGLEESDAYEILSEDNEANLGWRVALEFETEEFTRKIIVEAATKNVPLRAIIPDDVKQKIMSEVESWEKQQDTAEQSGSEKKSEDAMRIKLTSYEGAKGLSAQHVFILGLHEGEFPKDSKNIKDIEICRFLVGLTRTKKKCALLLTKNFASKWKNPSIFLDWIREERFLVLEIDAKYWPTI